MLHRMQVTIALHVSKQRLVCRINTWFVILTQAISGYVNIIPCSGNTSFLTVQFTRQPLINVPIISAGCNILQPALIIGTSISGWRVNWSVLRETISVHG